MKEIKMSNVYLMKLTSKEGSKVKEVCYKIGLSSNVERRAKEIGSTYDVDVVDTIELEIKSARRLEKTLHHDLFKDRYWPKLKFVGSTEVFKNKRYFKHSKNFLQGQWDAINDVEISKQYYRDKYAREQAAKSKYWKRRWN